MALKMRNEILKKKKKKKKKDLVTLASGRAVICNPGVYI